MVKQTTSLGDLALLFFLYIERLLVHRLSLSFILKLSCLFVYLFIYLFFFACLFFSINLFLYVCFLFA